MSESGCHGHEMSERKRERESEHDDLGVGGQKRPNDQKWRITMPTCTTMDRHNHQQCRPIIAHSRIFA